MWVGAEKGIVITIIDIHWRRTGHNKADNTSSNIQFDFMQFQHLSRTRLGFAYTLYLVGLEHLYYKHPLERNSVERKFTINKDNHVY